MPVLLRAEDAARLEARQTLSWVEELYDAGALGVGFGGGEPLAHPKFAWLCRQISERTGLAVSFTTHAHRITQQLAAELAGSVHFIRASMDGTGSTYEQLRGRSFNSFREKLKLIATIAPFGINVVVNDLTVTQLDEMAEFATAVGASELLLLPEQPVGDRARYSRGPMSDFSRILLFMHAGFGLQVRNPGTRRIELARATSHTVFLSSDQRSCRRRPRADSPPRSLMAAAETSLAIRCSRLAACWAIRGNSQSL
jgi:MoaA/NifB/PqqE/SkfB family radical SAM enzyme